MKTAAVFSRASDEWATPLDVRESLFQEFALDFDPCPIDGTNHGLLGAEWRGRAFVNPPYSDIRSWLDKALIELRAGRIEIAVFLLLSRTGTAWWHRVVLPFATEIRFLRGRLRFGAAKNSAPFDSVVVVFGKKP